MVITRYNRIDNAFIQAARQLEFLTGRSASGPTTDSLADALAIAQHHDAVSGTEKQHVANDYAKRLYIGYAEVNFLILVWAECYMFPYPFKTSRTYKTSKILSIPLPLLWISQLNPYHSCLFWIILFTKTVCPCW